MSDRTETVSDPVAGVPESNNLSAQRSAEASPAEVAVAAQASATSASGSVVGLWWAGLTVGALGVGYLLEKTDTGGSAAMAAVWAVHNLVGWSVTVRAGRHTRRRGTAGQLTVETWMVFLAAAWAVAAAAVWSGALAEWAIVPVIQVVFGLSLAATGASYRDGPATGLGLLSITSAPVLLALGEQANPGVWSILLMVVSLGASILSISLGWRRLRIEGQRQQDA